jgi:hypothetical protein
VEEPVVSLEDKLRELSRSSSSYRR